jgi:hypothetical protein
VSVPLGASEQSASRQHWPRVNIQDAFAAWAVRLALDGASRRLVRPRCQAIFSDFRDQNGRPLSERLMELGVSGQDYLAWIVFLDGSDKGLRRCEADTVMAVTSPGSRAVYLCGPKFARMSRHGLREGEIVILHEALHTLGLTENPPSSREITRQVADRCGP